MAENRGGEKEVEVALTLLTQDYSKRLDFHSISIAAL